MALFSRTRSFSAVALGAAASLVLARCAPVQEATTVEIVTGDAPNQVPAHIGVEAAVGHRHCCSNCSGL